MESNELTLKKESQLARSDAPHYYEVKIPNHPNGVPQMHCGNIRDAERVLEMYPDATMNKIYLPHPPDTVDVSCVTMENDKELPTIKIEGQEIPIQQKLPQNCQEPFIPDFHD